MEVSDGGSWGRSSKGGRQSSQNAITMIRVQHHGSGQRGKAGLKPQPPWWQQLQVTSQLFQLFIEILLVPRRLR